ncbi:MAG: permease [Bacillota bacterium]
MVKKYRFALTMFLVTLAVAVLVPGSRAAIVHNVVANVTEMLSIIPPIFLLLGLMDVWVPRGTFVRYMGPGSRVIGPFLAILVGAFAAGPLYGAFPVASMMLRKGASFRNVMILLGSWSTLKIPQILFETASLGPRFSLARMAANIPVILIIATAVDWTLSREEKEEIIKRQSAMEGRAAPKQAGAAQSK